MGRALQLQRLLPRDAYAAKQGIVLRWWPISGTQSKYDGRVFSYRHIFHAGNHGDVLKHICLVATLRHLMRKPTPLLLVDTHAGAGRYDLDTEQAQKSGEAQAGVLRLRAALAAASAALPPLLADYLALLQAFNAGAPGPWSVYPGSPALMHALMTEPARSGVADRLHLFEWHPTVHRLLREQVAGWPQARQVTVCQADGMASLKGQLPPPPAARKPRRAFVLMDPSYELKTDYEQVRLTLADALQRFASGVYMVWYPLVAQPGSRQLPHRLRELAEQAGRDWLQATLDVGRLPQAESRGLAASGVFVVNPPYTLADQLRESLPQVAQALSRGQGERWQVEQHMR